MTTAVAFMVQAGIISVVLGFFLNRLDRKTCEREQTRIAESVICMSMLQALGHLSEAIAIAQRDGKTNGEMKTAMEYYCDARDKLNDYIVQKSAERIHVR